MHNAFADAAARRMTLFLPLLLAAAGATAQPEQTASVSSDELKTFAVVYVEVRVLQTELEEKVDEVLERSDLDEDRFDEINRAAQESDASEMTGVTDAELDEHRNVIEDLLSVQDEVQHRMVNTVRKEGLTVERFNEIIDAVQTDPDLQTRAEATMERLIETRESADESDSATEAQPETSTDNP